MSTIQANVSFLITTNDPRDPHSLNFNIIHSIVIDRAGIYWIGTDGAGVNIMNPHKNHFFHIRHNVNNPNSLSGNFLKALYEDSHGMLWVGTVGHGLPIATIRKPQNGRNMFTTKKINIPSPAMSCLLFVKIATVSCG